MLLIVNLKLVLPSSGDRPASRQDMAVYKAMPKTAKRPPARIGAPYWAKLAAAPWLGVGVLDALAPEAPLCLAVDEAPAEVEAEAEELAPLSSMVRLPHFVSRARSHSNSCAAFWLVALTQALYQKRHIWPGTDCW
jgi:hypothetical protein